MFKLIRLIIFLALSLNIGIGLGQHKLPADVSAFVALGNLTLGQIYDMDFNANGQNLIISASAGLYLYDALQFRRQAMISPEVIGVFDLSPDRNQLVYSNKEGMHILDTRTWETVNQVELPATDASATIENPTFAPDNVTIATVSTRNSQPITISLWRRTPDESDYQPRTLVLDRWSEPNMRESLQWTPDGKHLVLRAGLYLMVIRVSDFLIVFETKDPVWTGLLSPDGQELLIAYSDHIDLLDTYTWQIQRSWEISSSWVMSWNPVDNAIIYRSGDWVYMNLNTGETQTISTFSSQASLTTRHILKWSPDGSTLVIVTNELETTIMGLDVLTWQLRYEQMTRIGNHNGNTAWSEDGNYIQTSEYLWNTKTLTADLHFPMQPSGHTFVYGQLSPAGESIATLTDEKELSIIDTKTESIVDQMSLPFFVWGMRWSPDSRYLAILYQEAPIQIDFLSLSDGIIGDRQSVTFPSIAQRNESLHWSPDGRHLLISGMIFAVQYQDNIVDLQPLWQTDAKYIPGSWTSDGQILGLVEFDSSTRLYNLQLREARSGDILVSTTIGAPEAINDIIVADWSPSGAYIAFGHEYRTVAVWLFGQDSHNILFKKVKAWEGHLYVGVGCCGISGAVTGLRWITETELHSIGADGVLRVWGIP